MKPKKYTYRSGTFDHGVARFGIRYAHNGQAEVYDYHGNAVAVFPPGEAIICVGEVAYSDEEADLWKKREEFDAWLSQKQADWNDEWLKKMGIDTGGTPAPKGEDPPTSPIAFLIILGVFALGAIYLFSHAQ